MRAPRRNARDDRRVLVWRVSLSTFCLVVGICAKMMGWEVVSMFYTFNAVMILWNNPPK